MNESNSLITVLTLILFTRQFKSKIIKLKWSAMMNKLEGNRIFLYQVTNPFYADNCKKINLEIEQSCDFSVIGQNSSIIFSISGHTPVIGYEEVIKLESSASLNFLFQFFNSIKESFLEVKNKMRSMNFF